MSSSLVGQIVANQFRVDAFISAGGMGTVFRVWDLKRNVPLAMKVLHADLAEDSVIFERFKREARALRKLEHPNIIPFYGLYQTPSLIFLLERYIDGPTLKEILSQSSGSIMPSQDILCIIKALCSAVGYAHNNDVIHCDIKAANVMIDQGGHVYLGDFGIARHADSDVTAMPGAGTPAYMAPEQILGNTVTRETDIYALGVLLFELLTGMRPFRGTERGTEKSGNTINERIRFAQLNLPAPDPRLFNPVISPHLSAIVLRALDKDPAARFSSCQELLVDLCQSFNTTPEQIPDRISSLPVSQPPPPHEIPTSPPPEKPTPQKYPMILIGGAVVVITLLVFFIASGLDPGSTANQFTPTVRARKETPTQTSENVVSQPMGFVPPTNTPKPHNTATLVERTSTYTPQSDSRSCSGAAPQRVKVGDRVEVCTSEDRLILRNDPSAEGSEIFRMYPGLNLLIISGPKCGDKTTWWKVRVDKGSWVWDGHEFATTQEMEGWVREGGFEGDLYYICPDK